MLLSLGMSSLVPFSISANEEEGWEREEERKQEEERLENEQRKQKEEQN